LVGLAVPSSEAAIAVPSLDGQQQITDRPGHIGHGRAIGEERYPVLAQRINRSTGVVTDVWGIPNSASAVSKTTSACLTNSMHKPQYYQAGLATSACNVTGIPCEVSASGLAYIAYDPDAGALSASVSFQHLNPYANGDFGNTKNYNGAETPIIGMHLHKGNSSVNSHDHMVYFCGTSPAPALHGLPSCSQQNNQVYHGYFLQPDGTFTTKVSGVFRDLMESKTTSGVKVEEFLYFNLHTTYSFAKTHGKGLIRAQVVATSSAPAFAVKGCIDDVKPVGTIAETAGTGTTTTGSPASTPCQSAVPGTQCFQDVIWAMSHGIQQHPEWYPGLSSSTSFDEFQAFLHTSKDANRTCPAPCGFKSHEGAARRLRGSPFASRLH